MLTYVIDDADRQVLLLNATGCTVNESPWSTLEKCPPEVIREGWNDGKWDWSLDDKDTREVFLIARDELIETGRIRPKGG